MIVNPYTGVVGSALSGAKGDAVDRVQKAIAQIAGGNRITQASDDVAGLSLALQLQSKTAGLRSAVGNISQALSVSSIASDAIGQMRDGLAKARDLAVQANSGAVDAASLASLDKAFAQQLAEVTRIAQTTQFNGKPLLNGSLSLSLSSMFGEPSTGDSHGLDVPSLDLLSSQTLDVKTAANASAAIAALDQAINTVGSVQASVGGFQDTLDVASASFESAIFNQDAARSLLSDTDLAQASTALSEAILQQNGGIAIQAQVTRLPPSMLELIN